MRRSLSMAELSSSRPGRRPPRVRSRDTRRPREWLALVALAWLLVPGAGHAQDYAPSQALQNRAAWAQHDATPRDCEQAYRSFRTRNTRSPSERRAERERCLEAAAAAKAQEKSPEHEVALGK